MSSITAKAAAEYQSGRQKPRALPPDHRCDPLHEALLREHLTDMFTQMESLSISAREAVWRGSDALAAIHFDQLRLVGQEIARSLASLEKVAPAREVQ